MADQQDKRKRVGARVWLHLDGEERTAGVLLSIAEIGVVIREDAQPSVVVLPWETEGCGDSWTAKRDPTKTTAVGQPSLTDLPRSRPDIQRAR